MNVATLGSGGSQIKRVPCHVKAICDTMKLALPRWAQKIVAETFYVDVDGHSVHL